MKWLGRLFSRENEYKENDPLLVPGFPDFLDVGGYAVYVLKNRGVDLSNSVNRPASIVLKSELEMVVSMYMGIHLTNETKEEVRRAVETVIDDFDSRGVFSR